MREREVNRRAERQSDQVDVGNFILFYFVFSTFDFLASLI